MKNIRLILLLMGSSLALHAQNQLELGARIYSGYDQNIYRVPDTYINSEGDTLDDIRQSGLFTLAGLSAEQTFKWDQHRLRFSGSGSARIYPGQPDNNLWRGQLGQEYLLKINRKWRLYEELKLNIYRRSGQDDSQDVIAIPLAYHQYNLLLGTQWNSSKQFYTKIEAGIGNKIYRPGETSSLRYGEKMLRTYARKKMKKGQAVEYLEGEVRFRHRNYLRESYTFVDNWEEDFDEDFEEDLDFDWDDVLEDFSESSFSMQYWNAEAAIKINAGEYLYWKPSIEWIRRKGSNPNFGYMQFKPGVYLNYQKGKNTLSFRNSYSIRSFDSLSPGEGDDLLRYQYLSTRINWTHDLNDKWSFNTSIGMTRRFSNYDVESSRLFRSYTTGSAMIGLRLKID